ncbi:hypothetical protein DRO57_00780 [Candidatus Bathyarchaeota archaeon]|nr:MAG: hypothetical protein DRO57_00780 [Candidatus Bathyarchaeota archaeon]
MWDLMTFYRYVDYLLKERKNLEEKLKTMSKAEMIRFGRQLIATYQQSLKGFDEWFTNYGIMEKMEPELVRDIVLNLMNIGFELLRYDRDVTMMWLEREQKELKRKKEEEERKRQTSII